MGYWFPLLHRASSVAINGEHFRVDLVRPRGEVEAVENDVCGGAHAEVADLDQPGLPLRMVVDADIESLACPQNLLVGIVRWQWQRLGGNLASGLIVEVVRWQCRRRVQGGSRFSDEGSHEDGHHRREESDRLVELVNHANTCPGCRPLRSSSRRIVLRPEMLTAINLRITKVHIGRHVMHAHCS